MACGLPDGTTMVTLPLVWPAALSWAVADADNWVAGSFAVLPATTPMFRLFVWLHVPVADDEEHAASATATRPAATIGAMMRSWERTGILSMVGRAEKLN
jgi:hypothetical protein